MRLPPHVTWPWPTKATVFSDDDYDGREDFQQPVIFIDREQLDGRALTPLARIVNNEEVRQRWAGSYDSFTTSVNLFIFKLTTTKPQLSWSKEARVILATEVQLAESSSDSTVHFYTIVLAYYWLTIACNHICVMPLVGSWSSRQLSWRQRLSNQI